MKKNIIIAITCFALGSATIVGANQAIQAIQNTELKVKLNGVVQEFKDEKTGEKQYPITYNDRTYLPLRNVAQLVGLNVDYDSNTNTALLSSSNIEVEDDNEYFWDYKSIEKYADLLNTSVYDEIHDKNLILRKTDIGQNTLASLIKKYGEDKGLQLFDELCINSSYYFYPGGDDTTFLEKETDYDEDYPIYFNNPINTKFVQVHEDMFNHLWSLIKYPDEHIDSLKDEQILKEMANDEVILNIRKNYEDFDDLTMEEKAHCAKYTTGSWDRPEDANYSVNKVLIMNGYNYKKDEYDCHARAKTLKITIKDKEYIINLEDTPECQIFDINYKTNDIFKPLDIKVEVLEKYPGTGHSKGSYSLAAIDSVYISDIQFDVDASVFAGGR